MQLQEGVFAEESDTKTRVISYLEQLVDLLDINSCWRSKLETGRDGGVKTERWQTETVKDLCLTAWLSLSSYNYTIVTHKTRAFIFVKSILDSHR